MSSGQAGPEGAEKEAAEETGKLRQTLFPEEPAEVFP